MSEAIIIISCTNISKSYEAHATKAPILKQINLSLDQGQILGIIGRSGAGKSTLLRIIGGLLPPDEGKVLLFGQSLWESPAKKQKSLLKKIGTVFQGLYLLSRYTVAENIALPLSFSGVSFVEQQKRVNYLAEIVGLQHLLHRYPHQLSGGQRQRVAIARALSTYGQILLCDELTSALDRETTFEILELLQLLNKELGVSILLITHDMEVVQEICERVCVLENGHIVEEGPIEDILLAPQHEATKGLLGHLTRQELPHYLFEQITFEPSPNAQAVVQLTFAGDVAMQPLFAEFISTYKVPVNIICGHLDHVRHTAFGHLIVMVPHRDSCLKTLLTYLASSHVSTEILGFVPWRNS